MRSVLILVLLAGIVCCGCERPQQNNTVVIESAKGAEWTPERIAADPLGYLKHADSRIVQQIAAHQQKMTNVIVRREEVDLKRKELGAKMADASNVQQRLATASRRADEEGRWPMKFAGRSFDKAKADAVLLEMTQFLEDRKPMMDAYDQAATRLEDAQNTIKKEIADLNRLKDKMAMDAERIRLNQGVAESTELLKTQKELAGFSKTLADISDDDLGSLRVREQTASSVDVETILGK